MPDLNRYAVETWIKTMATGEFHYTKVLDANIAKSSYGKLRKIMFDLVHSKDPVVESVGRKDGYYRPIQDMPQPVKFEGVKGMTGFPIELPFDLRKYVFLYPRTVILVGGSKSSCKTGFLYRTVAMNLGKVNIILLSNMEGGKEQMWDRFNAMGIDLTQSHPSLRIYEVSEHFHDFIKEPNTLYVIDYIDAPEGTDFYLIGAAIHKVWKKLDNSIAAIGLQKPMNRDIPFGGEATLKDAALYIALTPHKLKIIDAKVPTNPKVIPKNMQWTFQYDQAGTNFLNIQKSYNQEDWAIDK